MGSMKGSSLKPGVSVILLWSLVVMQACAAPEATASKGSGVKYPGWVSKGSAFYEGDWGRAFYGVGSSDLDDPGVRRDASETAARAELARVFKWNVGPFIKIYRSTWMAAGLEEEEALWERVRMLLSTLDLLGFRIVERYVDSSTGIEYALAMMDLDGYKKSVESVRDLPPDPAHPWRRPYGLDYAPIFARRKTHTRWVMPPELLA